MAVFVLISLYVSTFPKESISVIDYGFSFGWPVFLLFGWWIVSHKVDAQTVTHENIWIVGGLYLEAISLWPIAEFAGEGGASTVQSALRLPVFPLFLLFVLLTPALLPHISRYESKYEDKNEYLLVWFLLSATFFAVVFASIFSGTLQLQLRILAGCTFLGGIALAIVRYFNL
jgi:hypothetical protein